MNAGAAMARGDVFLFLHADTWLESGAFDAIESAIANERIVGGGFERRVRTESFFLRATCAMAALRNHAIGWHLGDQAIFCRAKIFRELGGFATMRAFEDVDFSRRLARNGKLVTLRPPVLSSARRFAEGPMKRTAKDVLLTMRYLLRPSAFRV
jgi:GT2 family glycosyltransferase